MADQSNPLMDALTASQSLGQTQQPAPAPPTASTGYGMPALVSMIAQMIHPHQQQGGPTNLQQPPVRPPSRASEFEQFLGNFTNSLAHGMAASGTGPGANIRGAGAAMMAPHEAAVETYARQQQAQQFQTQQAAQQAATAGTTQETQQKAALFPGQQQAQATANLTAGLNAQLLQRRLNFMDPDQMGVYLQNTAPPGMNPNEQSVWNAGVQQAMMTGKLDSISSAANKIFAQRGIQTRHEDSMATKVAEWQQGFDYKKFHDTNEDALKLKIADMQNSKAPATVIQSAIYANGALKTLDDADKAMQSLESRGVMGSLPANKVEDWIFGKGLVDPSLDAQTRKDIGTLRSALGLSASATLRAHTGRGSREMYDDAKSMLGAGQDWSALRGAMQEAQGLLKDYANAASDANINALRGRTSTTAPAASSGGRRVVDLTK